MLKTRYGVYNYSAAARYTFNAMLIVFLLCVALGIQSTAAVEAKELPSNLSKSLLKSPIYAPLYIPVAGVSLNLPTSVFIGQAFSFTATFDNTDADEVGYGPFIDIVFPVTGVDGAGAAVDDGVDFVSATYLGASVTAVQNTFGPANTGGCAGGLGPATHPYAVTVTTGAPHIVCGTPGDKLVTLLLPFGSFAPDQPPAVVTVNATLSNQADLNTSLDLRVRGGYQYGATPTNDWCCGDATIVSHPGTSTTWPASPVSPVLLSLAKTSNNPENETATGLNYPRQFTLTVDVATGQPVTNLTITDTLPDSIQYVSLASSSPAATCTTVPDPLTTPGGTLTCDFGTVTGGAGTSDATLTFNYYVPLNDSGGAPVINAVSGDDATSLNTSTAAGSWDPIDARDPITPASAGGVCPTGCYTLADKSLAIQKSVVNIVDTGSTGYSPGDTLQYTLAFQISDFFSFQNVVITDVLSDGQRITGSPTFQVNGNGFALGAASMNAANFTIDNSQIGNSGPNPPADGTDGSQTIVFRVSNEIITRGNSGKLIGGCIPVAGTGGPVPDCASYNDNATTGTLIFRSIIQGDFTDTYPSGDSSVDHGDILTNNVSILGDLLSGTNNSTVTGQNEADSSSTSISIAFGSLQKSVYAVNGTVCDPCATEISTNGVSVGDAITFRLRYSQPSSDFEQTVITDYLPLPIFRASTIGSFSNTVCGVPGAGTACLGPADSYHSLIDPNPVVVPIMSIDAMNNAVTFTYAAYDSENNTSSTIDLLFTVAVDDEPFADGLFLTNQANTSEGTTNAGNQVLNTILQIKINEPLLIPTKSAVSTDSTAAGITFAPAIAGPLVFDIPGVVDPDPDWTTNATPGWSAGEVINSTYLASNPIDADLSGIDGGDRIKFAIVIENRGHGIDGAFDIAIQDARPAELVIPASGLNLEVFLGDGTPISFTDLGGSLFGNGIKLVDPGVPPSGACQGHDATSGQNVVIITYDLQLSGTGVTNPDIINTTTLLSYSSSSGGPNYIPSGVTDTVEVTPATPALAKTLKTSSEAHTSDVSNPPRAAIGEIFRYRLRVYLPEGTFTNFQIDDNLPGGLVYQDDGTARVAFISNGTGISSEAFGTMPVPAIPGSCVVTGNETTAIPDPLLCTLADFNVGINTNFGLGQDTDTQASFTPGLDPQFKLGTLTNADSDADREVVLIEFNALVDNSAAGSNDASENRDNTFRLNVNGAGYGLVSAAQRVRVSEPSITNLNKIVNPTAADAGNVVTYTVTFSNGSSVNNTTAFDVILADAVPAHLSVNLGSLTTSYLPAACSALTANSSAGNNINLTFASIPTSCQVTVTYQATLLGTAIPGEALTNIANLTYTSLPGSNGTAGNSTGTNNTGASGSDTGERNGSSGLTPHNDFFDSDGAQVNVTQIQLVKSILGTSASHTPETGDGSVGNPRALAIGEEITYGILLTFGEGTTPADTVVDDLPSGLEIVAGTPAIITTAAASGGLLAADFNGTIGTQVIDITPGDDGVVSFDFTNIAVAGDNDVTNNSILLRFTARVTNIAANIAGATISNSATNQVGVGTPTTSNSVIANVVEPRLNVAKTADDSSWSYGQTVTFTLDVSHDATSQADAFEVVVTDVIPVGLTYVGSSISAPAGWMTNASAPNLTFICSTANGCFLPFAGTAALTYQVTVDSPPNPNAIVGDAIVTNTANMQWTSLPGDNNPGNPSGERDGSGGAVNNYNDSSSHTGGLVGYYALGNRVWFDTDNDSQIDFGTEVGVDGVVVNLYRATDLNIVIATDTTSGGGYYLFDYLEAGDYVVAVDASNFADGAVLDTYLSSGTTLNGAGVISETAAPDADTTPTDSDDNGTLQSGGPLAGAVAALTITLGPGASEPAGETDSQAVIGDGDQPDARANMTVDFGFYRTGIGNLVWLEDVAANGVYDVGETVIGNASVRLYASNGTTEILVGPDGALGTTDDAINGVVTNAGGLYAFSGLPQGDYIVRVVGPAGTISTTDAFNAADTNNPTNNIDNNDNGIGSTSNSVSSGTLPVTPGLAQINNMVTQSTGTTTNPTVDFGFAYPYSVGNRVWFDTDNDSQIDFGTEVGVDGVTVELYAADGAGNPAGSALGTDTTTNGGYYLFDDLLPGNYVVVIPAANFAGAGVLTGYWSSATTRAVDGTISEVTAPLTESNIDSDDNGTRQISGTFANAVISSAVALGPIGLTEPSTETDLETGIGQGSQPNGRANMTVDFGFYRVAVGNLVFGDLNKNGAYNAGDTLLSNVTVELLSANGASLGITTTTDVNGLYQFAGLPQGDYIVRTTAPSGTASTIDSFNQIDNDNPNTNADNNDNGDGTGNGAVSSAVFSLTPGIAQNFNTVDNATGSTANPTLDFGFSLAYALGNRVWFDTDNNSQIDLATEVGVDGVVVDLYAAGDLSTVLASDTTTGGGYYLFNNLDAGSYVVAVRAANFASGAILDGYWSSGTTRNANGSLTEAAAPSPDASASDTDDNGMLQTSGTLSGAVAAQAVMIGPGGVEPTGETDLEGGAGQGQPDAQANMTVDFGFYTIQLGNLVWNDNNVQDSGQFDAAEAGIQFVAVQLWSSDGTQLIAADTTDATGIYTFTGLPQGSYIVRIPASEFNLGGTLRDYVSSTGGLGSPYEAAPGPDANTNDSDDNGTITGGVLGLGGYVQSAVFALTPAAEESVNSTLGLTLETRVDFGVFVNAQTDLSVTKTDGANIYIPNGSLNYTITVTNNGPSDANGATVFDTRPAQISSWIWTCAAGTSIAYNCTDSVGNPGTFSDLLDLPQGASVTYNVAAMVSGVPTGDLTNSVTISVPAGVTETNPGNNTADDIDQLASLQVTKDDGLLIVGPGSTVTYQIVVTNNGAVNSTSVNVTDTLPADLIYQSATPAPTSAIGNALAWSGLSLASGASLTINVTATVNASPLSTTIDNVVNVTDLNTGTTATANDQDSVASSSDFTKTMVGTDALHTTDPAVTIGEILTYQLSLAVPPGSMNNALIVDTPHAGLAFVDCVSIGIPAGVTSTTLANGACNTLDGSAVGSNPLVENSGGKVTFDFGTIANANAGPSTVVITYQMIVLDVRANQNSGALQNNVVWTWSGGSIPTSSPALNIVEPDMSIDKNASATQAPYGAPITFTLDVAHTAASTAHAYDVVVTDILPAGLAFIPGSLTFTGLAPTSNTYDPASFTLTFIWDEFQLGQTARITFNATFVGPSPVVNSTNVYWSSLPIDPTPTGPVHLSPYNMNATERWYDPSDTAGLNNYGFQDSVTISLPKLPETGFAPGVETTRPIQPDWFSYADLGDFWVEIPQLGVQLPIVGVPLNGEGWNLTWLDEQAGWLEGSAYPTHNGNSVITAHVYDADGQPGPFVNLNKLYWGHKIIVHLGGQKYVYEVREVRTVWPNDKKVFQHEELAWLTMITCKDYNEKTDSYAQRVAVRAILISVED
jgi:LPXTG-site transpeptidase (sortase) family protein